MRQTTAQSLVHGKCDVMEEWGKIPVSKTIIVMMDLCIWKIEDCISVSRKAIILLSLPGSEQQ